MTLKERPEDFVVTEQLTEGLLAAIRGATAGPFAVYELQKSGLDTPQAVARLARATKTKPTLWRWAGLKDTHAQTTQAVSVAWPQGAGDPPASIAEPSLTARLLGFAPQHLKAQDIAANHFTIRVSGLSRARAEAMRRRAKALRDPATAETMLLPNYYGDQRFSGVIHPSAFPARELLHGDLEAALKLTIATPRRKEAAFSKAAKRLIAANWGDWPGLLTKLDGAAYRRLITAMCQAPAAPFAAGLAALDHLEARMLRESYQSWLFNRLVAAWATRLQADAFVAKDRFGPLPFPKASLLSAYREQMLALPAPEACYEGVFGELARDLYAAEALSAEVLELPLLPGWRFGSAQRPLVVEAREVRLEPLLPDPQQPARFCQTLHVTLPRGAYATILLRALGE